MKEKRCGSCSDDMFEGARCFFAEPNDAFPEDIDGCDHLAIQSKDVTCRCGHRKVTSCDAVVSLDSDTRTICDQPALGSAFVVVSHHQGPVLPVFFLFQGATQGLTTIRDSHGDKGADIGASCNRLTTTEPCSAGTFLELEAVTLACVLFASKGGLETFLAGPASLDLVDLVRAKDHVFFGECAPQDGAFDR